MTKQRIIRLTATILALLMPILTASIAWGTAGETTEPTAKYTSPNINELMGAGQEPEDISVFAGAVYQEKAWYEYVMYSEHAIASVRIDDEQRLLFYDPYTYTNSMVMDVHFDATTTAFDTMSSYSIAHTNAKTISACVASTETNTIATQSSGRDVTYSYVQNGGNTKTTYNHSVDTETSGTVTNETGYEYVPKKDNLHSWTVDETFSETTKIGNEFGVDIEVGNGRSDTYSESIAWLTDKVTNTTKYEDGYKTTTTYSGDATLEDLTYSTTDGWTELADRITKTTGSSSTTTRSWSETESTTITKVYAATHFASDGVTPLPWAIVHYEVQMPMKCCLQVKHSGEWITISTIYTLLTTVKGTCRAWMQNGQVYYEDWGNGEPVVATDFWSQFMTKDQLMNAYKDKLYPTGGED